MDRLEKIKTLQLLGCDLARLIGGSDCANFVKEALEECISEEEMLECCSMCTDQDLDDGIDNCHVLIEAFKDGGVSSYMDACSELVNKTDAESLKRIQQSNAAVAKILVPRMRSKLPTVE